MEKQKQGNSGITLIALIVTIIVLIILAGISIGMLAGDNSILQRATDAKTQTGVGQEKEALSLAWNSCMVNKVAKYEDITDVQLANELKNNGYNDVSVKKSGNKFKVVLNAFRVVERRKKSVKI